MIEKSQLPTEIPVFPLPGALMLPRARLPLHIFEPRYVQMIEDSLKTPSRLIGMIQLRNTPDGTQKLQSIGCAGRLTGFSETDGGRYMITLSGVSRFRVCHEVDGAEPYRRCVVDWASFAHDLSSHEEKDPGFEHAAFERLLGQYIEKMQLPPDLANFKAADPEVFINALAMLCPFASEEKQALLEAPSLETRRETLVMLMEFALLGGGDYEALQ